MWSNIKINNDSFLISITQEDEVIKILLTNLIEIWMEKLTDEIILEKCRNLNPLLNVTALNHTEVVLNILNDISKYIVEASVDHIKLRAKIKDGFMKFALNLTKGTPQDFWEIITKPLCLTGMEIIHQRNFLLDLIKKKDEEIAEYKAEGAQLIRKNIETKVFNEEEFKTNISTSNTDCTDAFQGMVNFYNEFNLCKQNTTSTESTSWSSGNDEKQEMNDKNVHKNQNTSMKAKLPNKKTSPKKTGTANIVYKPVKKLKGLNNSIL